MASQRSLGPVTMWQKDSGVTNQLALKWGDYGLPDGPDVTQRAPQSGPEAGEGRGPRSSSGGTSGTWEGLGPGSPWVTECETSLRRFALTHTGGRVSFPTCQISMIKT